MNKGVNEKCQPKVGDTIRFTHSGLAKQGIDGERVFVTGVVLSLEVEPNLAESGGYITIGHMTLEGTDYSAAEFFDLFMTEEGQVTFSNVRGEDFKWEIKNE